MKLAAWLGGLILLALALPFVLPPPSAQRPEAHLPWNIVTDGHGGSSVMGLRLPGSTLADAVHLHGPEHEIALIMDAGRALALEAYLERVQLGFVTGRLILTLAVPDTTLSDLAERVTDASGMRSGARKLTLAAEDQRAALAWPISSVTLIPSASLDMATVQARFGEPARRIDAGEGREHLLYPERGLDILLDPKGRELLQYVAPADFDRLSAPLTSAEGGLADRSEPAAGATN